MDRTENVFSSYFGVLGEGRTYLNLLYLFLAFPLGIFYFVFLVTGFSVGIPLIIIWIGLLILALVFAASWAFTAFERQMAIGMLRVEIPPMSLPQPTNASFWERIKSYLSNPVTWKGLLFLFLKFPIGIITFTLEVTFLAIALGFIFAPLIYRYGNINIGDIWYVDTMTEAAVLTLIGVLLLPAILHFFNLIANWLGMFAKVMLGIYTPAQTASLPPVEPVTNSQQ